MLSSLTAYISLKQAREVEETEIEGEEEEYLFLLSLRLFLCVQ